MTYIKRRRCKPYKKYNKELARKVIRDYNDGILTIIQIMSKYGISQSLLYRCLQQNKPNIKTGGDNDNDSIFLNIKDDDDDNEFINFQSDINRHINDIY